MHKETVKVNLHNILSFNQEQYKALAGLEKNN